METKVGAAIATSSQQPAPQIVELSDDEDEETSRDATVSTSFVSTNATSVNAVEDAKPSTARNLDAQDLGDSDSESDLEAFDDTESLINDLVFSEGNDDGGDEEDEMPDGEYCTSEEAAHYKRRLREMGVERFVDETIAAGTISAKKLMTAFGVKPPFVWEGSPDERYYRALGMLMIEEISKRQKLPQYNTIDDVIDLLRRSSNIMVITGAGISTNLGIPDFRSTDSGFYSQMKRKGFSSPEDIFDLDIFDQDPSVFYENSGATFAPPGKTSPTHAFIALLQQKGKLLTNYTQNIDNIEASAGITKDKLIQCHGSWATATCRKCKHKVPGEEILAYVKRKEVAYCPLCKDRIARDSPIPSTSTLAPMSNGLKRKHSSTQHKSSKRRKHSWEDSSDSDSGQHDIPTPGILKPDITFFKEPLPPHFFERFNGSPPSSSTSSATNTQDGKDSQESKTNEHTSQISQTTKPSQSQSSPLPQRRGDKLETDLCIVIGTSMKVAPVSEMPRALPPSVPHIYISNSPCRHIDFDVTLLGDCDVICGELARRVGWDFRHELLREGRVEVREAEVGEGCWSVRRVESGKD